MDISAALAARNFSDASAATRPDASAAAGRAADDFMSTMQQAESAARASMAGQGNPHDLVAALSQTKMAVETVVTVRDKVVEAYQEIMRMPV